MIQGHWAACTPKSLYAETFRMSTCYDAKHASMQHNAARQQCTALLANGGGQSVLGVLLGCANNDAPATNTTS